MIYSTEAEKSCAVCQKARRGENEMFCTLKKQTVPLNGAVCKKFSYDILKRQVRRVKRLNTDFKPEDFLI